MSELDILLEDGPLIAVNKPAGLPTQGAAADSDSLVTRVKEYLRRKYDKPGNVYLGTPHRLDRPVSGVVVFARNSKAAARLAEQFEKREVRKIYWARLEQPPDPAEGTLTDWLLRPSGEPRIVVASPDAPAAREAVLHYRTLETTGAGTLIEIELVTGRMHQIRVQFGSRGWPVVGDTQYGARTFFEGGPETIALHARSLTLRQPIRYDELTITAPLPPTW